LDVSEFARIRAFAKEYAARLAGRSIDVLVNNAGTMPAKRTLTSEGREAIAACHMGGTVLLTGLLLPLMRPGARVINVSSGGQYAVAPRVTDLNFDLGLESESERAAAYDGTLYYAHAKRHQVMLSEFLAEKLGKPTGVAFHSMHPGWAATTAVATAMPDFYKTHEKTLRSAAQGADTIVYLAASPAVRDDPGGGFWFDRERVRKDMPWGGTEATPAQRQRLFNLAHAFVGGSVPALDSAVDAASL
jgi:dehydrogenase/reductase SDR family protein 12